MAWDYEETLRGTERRGPQVVRIEVGCSHTLSALPPQLEALASCWAWNVRVCRCAGTPRPKPSEPPDGIGQDRPEAAPPCLATPVRIHEGSGVHVA